MKLKDLRSNPQNPRYLTESDFQKLLNKLLTFPRLLEKNKITFDSEQGNTILGGNMRFKALNYICDTYTSDNIKDVIKTAQNSLNVDSNELFEESLAAYNSLIRYKVIPENWVQDAKGLSEEEKQAFIVIDNVSDGKWDFDALANNWDIDFEAWGLVDWGNDTEAEDTDFDDEHLNAKEDDYQEPENLKVDVVLGDLIEIGQHRLLCGDSTNPDDVAKLMNGKKADMVFTDPPYNTGMSSKKNRDSTRLSHMFNDNYTDEEWENLMSCFCLQYYELLKEDSVAYICLDWRRNHELIKHIKKYFKISNIIVWDKMVHGLGSDYKYTYELINVCKKGKPLLNTHQGEREYSDVWHIQRAMGKDKDHATKKPIEICSRPIRHASKKGDLVVDLFLGSGSTMAAAHQLNRKCYGMELEPKYCQVIINRMQKLDPSLIVKINGKEYKAETPF